MPGPLDYEHLHRPGYAKEPSFTGPVLLIAFGVGGAVLGLGAGITLWLIFGGWGPPFLLLFVGLGLVLGVIASFAKPAKRSPR